MSKITLAPNASGTGTLTVAAPNTNTDRTITLPDATGTMNISGLANEVPAGSAGSPSIYSTGDSNTGIFFPAADTIAFAEGGAEAMRIDSSGNVGIGTSSPAYRVDVASADTTAGAGYAVRIRANATAAAGAIQFTDSTAATQNGIIAVDTSSNMKFTTSLTERMRIDASGNVSITQTPGKYTVDVSGGATSIANGGTVDFANASGMLVVNNHNSGAVTIYLCGGGTVNVIGSVGTQVGTFAYVAGIGGYRWTNNFGSTISVGFFFVRTRTTG